MIKYGTLVITSEYKSLSIAKQNNTIVRHYPFTDASISHDLGKGPVSIKMTVAVKGDSIVRLEQLLATPIERNLIINDRLYLRVIPAPDMVISPIHRVSDDSWTYNLGFIALDPIPYDAVTGGALY